MKYFITFILMAFSISGYSQSLSASLVNQWEPVYEDSLTQAVITLSEMPDSSRFIVIEFIDLEVGAVVSSFQFDLVDTNLSSPGAGFERNDTSVIISINNVSKFLNGKTALVSISDKERSLLNEGSTIFQNQ